MKMSTAQARITFQQFMERCLMSRALLEEYSYCLYRTDNNTVLERGVKGYEAAKEKATALRKKLGLRWDQIKFKAERPSGGRQFGVSRDGKNFTNAYGQGNRVEYSPRYNPSKGRRFRGYTDANGN
jgi:hypothetical protein